MSIESVMPSSHLILCHPLLLLPPIPPSIRVFSNESALRMRWPKYWSFSFSIIPSKEHLGLIFFRMDWLDLLAVQATLKTLLQHRSSKEINSSVLSCVYSPTLTPAHVSAGEESAREPTSVTHSQGTHRDNLWLSGAADSSQGPWEPGVLRAALSLGGKATAEGALLLPFASL